MDHGDVLDATAQPISAHDVKICGEILRKGGDRLDLRRVEERRYGQTCLAIDLACGGHPYGENISFWASNDREFLHLTCR